jgi:acetyl-CoA C-acetyltransferase
MPRTLFVVTIDPRTPVIIGVAQVSHRAADGDNLSDAPDPIDLMAKAVREASADTQAPAADVLAALDTVAVIGGLWRHKNPGALVADEVGLTGDIHTILTTFGGNLPIQSIHTLAERVQSGEVDAAVLAGGECNQSRRALAKLGEKPRRREEAQADEAESWGPLLDMGDRVAVDRGGETPFISYAVLDSAIRASRGETIHEARDRGAALWSGYAAVAAENPHAADQQGLSVDEIRIPSASNRMVAWPYTKAMCANNNVDQAGAIIICSTAKADELGVPAERRVYPHLCVNSEDTKTLVDRENLAVAPGLVATAGELIEALGSVDTIDHVELYSCFPSIVTLTTSALGLDTSGPLTTTGGLAFAGAPLNFAAGQGLIGMVATLRNDPGSVGVVQGNGGHASKHALGVYSTDAPTTPHHVRSLGRIGTPMEIADPDRPGTGTVRGITVEYDHTGPSRAVAVVEFDDRARVWAVSTDTALMERVTTEEMVGARVTVADGQMSLS